MVEVILLAAGQSKRFGKNKLLHKLENGKEIVCQCITNINQAGFNPKVIVQENDTRLINVLRSEKCIVSECKDSQLGMAHTLAFAIRHYSNASAWLICLADMPYILPDTIKKLHDSLQNTESLCAPIYQDSRGHPVGFGRKYYEELANLEGDNGAKSLLHKYQNNLINLEVSDPGVLRDIDYPKDLII